MASRFKSRQQALQTMFLWDTRGVPVREAIDSFYGSLASEEAEPTDDRDLFAEDIALGTVAQISDIDAMIGAHSSNWRIERMPVVDRNILRIAVWEMKNMKTPAAVVIDQALELGRRFAGDESISFLNGVLDAVNQQLHGHKGDKGSWSHGESL